MWKTIFKYIRRIKIEKLWPPTISVTNKHPGGGGNEHVESEDSEHVWSRPLAKVVRSCLEVLLPNFTLQRTDNGYILSVQFDDDTDAIWTRGARTKLRCSIEESVVGDFEDDFREFMAGNRGERFRFKQGKYPGLKFRYASGGTLPIIQLEGQMYYSLFYRDIPPVGWNIANGACDTQAELLYPIDTIERELREEMIIINPGQENERRTEEGIRYVFPLDQDKPQDHPDFAVARKLWKQYFPRINDFQVAPLNIRWIEGPDRVEAKTLLKLFDNEVKGCFVNINAEDLGIELDRVAIINLNKGDIILDGEISGGGLLNRVVGLFKIDEVNRNIDCAHAFTPVHFFYTGEWDFGDKHVTDAIEHFLKEIDDIRSPEEKAQYRKARQKNKELDMCPVTRTIIRRYIDAQQ